MSSESNSLDNFNNTDLNNKDNYNNDDDENSNKNIGISGSINNLLDDDDGDDTNESEDHSEDIINETLNPIHINNNNNKSTKNISFESLQVQDYIHNERFQQFLKINRISESVCSNNGTRENSNNLLDVDDSDFSENEQNNNDEQNDEENHIEQQEQQNDSDRDMSIGEDETYGDELLNIIGDLQSHVERIESSTRPPNNRDYLMQQRQMALRQLDRDLIEIDRNMTPTQDEQANGNSRMYNLYPTSEDDEDTLSTINNSDIIHDSLLTNDNIRDSEMGEIITSIPLDRGNGTDINQTLVPVISSSMDGFDYGAAGGDESDFRYSTDEMSDDDDYDNDDDNNNNGHNLIESENNGNNNDSDDSNSDSDDDDNIDYVTRNDTAAEDPDLYYKEDPKTGVSRMYYPGNRTDPKDDPVNTSEDILSEIFKDKNYYSKYYEVKNTGYNNDLLLDFSTNIDEDYENPIKIEYNDYGRKQSVDNVKSNVSKLKRMKFPINSNDFFYNWESHGSMRFKELDELMRNYCNQFSEDESNYNNIPDLQAFGVRFQPASKFEDGLKLKFLNLQSIGDEFDSYTQYKNNLTIFVDSLNLFVTCKDSDLQFYAINNSTNQIIKPHLFTQSLKPQSTTHYHYSAANSTINPHTVNFMKLIRINNEEIISCGMDDGRVVGFSVQGILDDMGFKMKRKYFDYVNDQESTENKTGTTALKLRKYFDIDTYSSVWGIDYYNKYNLLVASNNNRKIVIFYFDPITGLIHEISSHSLRHNIPCVSFIKDDDSYELVGGLKINQINNVFAKERLESPVEINIAACCISGEFVIFNTKLYTVQLALKRNEIEISKYLSSLRCTIEFNGIRFFTFAQLQKSILNSEMRTFSMNNLVQLPPALMSKEYIFERTKVIYRTVHNDQFWTVTNLNSNFFKNVKSFQMMTGDMWLDQHHSLYNEILTSSKLLDAESDYCESSHLGLASCFQHFNVPTSKAGASASKVKRESINSRNLYSTNEFIIRIKKFYDEYYILNQRNKIKKYVSKINTKEFWESKPSGLKFKNNFLFTSTATQVGLFRSDRLICNASCTDVFGFCDIPLINNINARSCDRISFSLVIPEISVIIVASQVGGVSIFRLTEHRGCFGFRQEYIFPNTLSLLLNFSGFRMISGLTYKRLETGRYIIFVTYNDNLLLTYELYEELLTKTVDFPFVT
ncbi:unnamed protein product [[Candida] boidinii]|uniref:Unnamed protein product n=1 Tax=Candida boidinii TaxID=5477 RepID=A0ACB5TG91_CANBO|nr:unnamed protein product [[Candida] boidinii]